LEATTQRERGKKERERERERESGGPRRRAAACRCQDWRSGQQRVPAAGVLAGHRSLSPPMTGQGVGDKDKVYFQRRPYAIKKSHSQICVLTIFHNKPCKYRDLEIPSVRNIFARYSPNMPFIHGVYLRTLEKFVR
jgi:hypothetical protein